MMTFKTIWPAALAALVLAGCTATPRPELDAALVSHATAHATLSPELSRQCGDPTVKAEFQDRLRVSQEPQLSPRLTRRFADLMAGRYSDEPELARKMAVYIKKYHNNGIFGESEYSVVCFYELDGSSIRYLESRRGFDGRVDLNTASLYRAMGGKDMLKRLM
jgi:hypothetical protein